MDTEPVGSPGSAGSVRTDTTRPAVDQTSFREYREVVEERFGPNTEGETR